MKFCRNTIDLPNRLKLGLQMEESAGEYGFVTRLAQAYEVSRWFLYKSSRNLTREALRHAIRPEPKAVGKMTLGTSCIRSRD